MNNIAFNILPSPESNDHEVRILIDNEDFLGPGFLGIDPSVFFDQENFYENGAIMIGRCTCGCEGCSDYVITVAVDNDTIIWTDDHGLHLIFNKQDYQNSINYAKNDHSWEDIKRKVERLTTNILKYSKTKNGYLFDWASSRIKNNKIVLSYSKNGVQKLFDIDWDGYTEHNVEYNTKQFFKEHVLDEL